MRFLFHVNEIDDNNAADISKPELIGNLFSRFHIGLKDCLFKVFSADIAACVDINHCEGFGGFNDDVATGTQPYLFFQGTADFNFNAVGIQQRYFIFIMCDPVPQLRHEGFNKIADPFKSCTVIHNNPLYVMSEKITDSPLGYIQVFIYNAGHGSL